MNLGGRKKKGQVSITTVAVCVSGGPIHLKQDLLRITKKACRMEEFKYKERNVYNLQSASLVVLSVDPRPEGELCDEDLSCFGKQDRSFCADHLYSRDSVTPG